MQSFPDLGYDIVCPHMWHRDFGLMKIAHDDVMFLGRLSSEWCQMEYLTGPHGAYFIASGNPYHNAWFVSRVVPR